MRKLTITRRKTFVGCAMKMKVYIYDNSGVCDLMIDGIPCRFYGKIKNGGTQTFEICDEAVRVYVVFDKMSADYCNDVYIIPEGTEDVSLSGICKFNLATGNAFRFDGNNHPDAIANRHKGHNKGSKVMVIMVAIGGFIGLVLGFLLAILT